MKFFKQKGQAALEFLTTYGWAFLVILVMIGALAGFGILTPSNFLPDRCNFASELSCSESAIVADDETDFDPDLKLFLKNNIGNSVKIDPADIEVESEYISGTYTGCTIDGSTDTATISASDAVNITCSDMGEFPAPGEKAKIQVDLKYTPVGKNLAKAVQGEIFTDIQVS
ncbi:MAG: hypothetical protein ACLFTH_02895 [Candidatus Woesearchaeota archaeon]